MLMVKNNVNFFGDRTIVGKLNSANSKNRAATATAATAFM